jgi:hypothetical protein
MANAMDQQGKGSIQLEQKQWTKRESTKYEIGTKEVDQQAK